MFNTPTIDDFRASVAILLEGAISVLKLFQYLFFYIIFRQEISLLSVTWRSYISTWSKDAKESTNQGGHTLDFYKLHPRTEIFAIASLTPKSSTKFQKIFQHPPPTILTPQTIRDPSKPKYLECYSLYFIYCKRYH